MILRDKSYSLVYIVLQSDVWICMELMATCLDKLMKKLKAPLPERILGKVVVAVSRNSKFVSLLEISFLLLSFGQK